MSERDRIEQEFDAIVQEAVEKMERVTCPIEDYYAALRAARSRFDDLVQMVRAEMGRGGHE